METKSEKIKLFLYISILGFIVCLFTIFVSPLYDCSEQDSNVLLTIGRGWLNGKMPYRDLYDHKGFILHFLYLLSALIQSNGYLGIFIIHTIITIIDLFGIYKLISLFTTNKRYIIATITIAGLLMNIHTLGGNALQGETIAIGCYCYALYIMIKCLRDNITITNKQWYIIGITSSLLLWSKITLTGFYIGYIIPYFILCLKNKQIKTFIKNIGFIILGILTITIPAFLYMYIQGYFKDFLQVYFYDNMFSYDDSKLTHLQKYWSVFLHFLRYTNITLFPIIAIFIKRKTFKNSKTISYKLTIILSFMTLCILHFFNRSGWGYYYNPFIIYTALGIYITISDMDKKGYFKGILKVQRPSKTFKEQMVLAIIPIVLLTGAIITGNVFDDIRRYTNRNEFINEVITDIENDWQDLDTIPNVLEYDITIGNEYVKWDYVPQMRNFICLWLINKEASKKERFELIEAKTPDYILVSEEKQIEGYKLLKQYPFGENSDALICILYDRSKDSIYLYKRAE